jgi:hypothetical protein
MNYEFHHTLKMMKDLELIWFTYFQILLPIFFRILITTFLVKFVYCIKDIKFWTLGWFERANIN